jgi:RNA polymerase sigma factor (sigma-70 family)
MPFVATNEASAQLFIKSHRVLEDLALTYVNDREQAIDIVQDMILVMLERERTFESKASCVCYMKQIVRNKAKNYLRKTAAIELWESMNEITMEDINSFDDVDSKLCLQRLLLKYPAEIREAFICHVINGDPSRILAEQLNISPDTLRRQFSRMKQDLLRKASSLGKKTLLLLILSVPFD